MTEFEKLAYTAGQTAALTKFGSAGKQLRLAVLHAVDEIVPILVRKIRSKQEDSHKKHKRKH